MEEIKDREYYKKLAEKSNELAHKYEYIYDIYTQKQWVKTVQLIDETLPLCQEKDLLLKSKFEYIRAVAIGQIEGEEALKTALTNIIVNYPKLPVAELAETYLSLFADVTETLAAVGDTLQQKILEQRQLLTESPFIESFDEQHYIIVIVNIHKQAVNDVKVSLTDFGREYFSLQKFNINSFYINQNEQLITISKFKNRETAMEYYYSVIINKTFAPLIDNKAIVVYAISATNYTSYYNKADKREMYDTFFNLYYLTLKE